MYMNSLSSIRNEYPNAIGIGNYSPDAFYDCFLYNDGTIRKVRDVLGEDYIYENDYFTLFDDIPDDVIAIMLNAEFN